MYIHSGAWFGEILECVLAKIILLNGAFFNAFVNFLTFQMFFLIYKNAIYFEVVPGVSKKKGNPNLAYVSAIENIHIYHVSYVVRIHNNQETLKLHLCHPSTITHYGANFQPVQ